MLIFYITHFFSPISVFDNSDTQNCQYDIPCPFLEKIEATGMSTIFNVRAGKEPQWAK